MLAVKERAPVKRRSKGEQTRHNILVAAIDVLAKHGIKGTTHRAVASHADIQLSLTTYYFKDIQELVHQAFQLNTIRTMDIADAAWVQAFEVINALGKTKLRKVSIREELRKQLSAMATEYIINKVTHQATNLAVEQLLFTEIQVSPELRVLANAHKGALLEPFVKLCSYFDKDNAEVDGDLLLTIFTQIEYSNITGPVDEIDRELVYRKVDRIIGWIMKLKG